MSASEPTSGTDRNPVEMLAEEFVERQRRGERPSLTEYTLRYPELAEAIRRSLPRPGRDGTGQAGRRGDATGGVPEASSADGTRRQPAGAGSAISGSSARSAGAAWGSSTRPCRSRWAGTWR